MEKKTSREDASVYGLKPQGNKNKQTKTTYATPHISEDSSKPEKLFKCLIGHLQNPTKQKAEKQKRLTREVIKRVLRPIKRTTLQFL